jgi:hypothetical protein
VDYLALIFSITSRMSSNGYDTQAKEVETLVREAMTSSELLMTVTHHLLRIMDSQLELRKLIGTEVKMLVDYCATIGLLVK